MKKRNKYFFLEKEWYDINKRFNNTFMSRNAENSYNGHPVEWVPAPESIFLGWSIKIVYNNSKDPHKDYIQALLNMFEIFVKNVNVIKTIRKNNKNFDKSLQVLRVLLHGRRDNHLLSRLSLKYCFYKNKAKYFEELDKDLFNKYVLVDNSRNPTCYYLKLYELPTKQFYYKITSIKSTEIGLLDPEWESNYHELKQKRYDHSNKYIRFKPKYRDRWNIPSYKRSMAMTMHELKKLDFDNQEAIDEVLYRKNKAYNKRENKKFIT